MTNSVDPDHLASDLELHCLLRQGMLCSAREMLSVLVISRRLHKHILPSQVFGFVHISM